MPRNVHVVIGLLLVAGTIRPLAAEETPPAARWIPRDSVASLEISRPQAILNLLLDSKISETVVSHPLYKHATSQPGFQQFRGVISYLEGQLGVDWKTGLKKLTGGGATAAITSKGVVIVMIDAEDADFLTRLHEMVVGFAKGDAERQGNAGRVKSVDYRGAKCWELGDNQAHTVLGRRFISASKPEGLKAVLDTKAGTEAQSLLSLPAYQAAKKAAGEDAAARAYVNLGIIKQIPGVHAALDKNTNPLGALLFAGMIDAVRQSNWLALSLNVDKETLSVAATMDGRAGGKADLSAFARSEKPGEGAMPNLSVPRRIAAMSFYRDLHGFYAAKDKLFPERTSGLIFFENMMAIFFSGRDLTEEVFSQFRPEIRFVVAEQKYDPEFGIPQVQFPSFAVIFKVFHPKEAAELMEEAFQKAVGLVSFTSGQKGVPGYIVDRPTHSDVRYTVAYSGKVRGEEKGPVGIRYNFRPTLALLGDSVILSSADSLARDLIDAIKKEMTAKPKPLADTNSLVEVDAVQISSILGANRKTLVRNNMMEKGASQQEAENNIGVLVNAVKLLGNASLSFGEHDKNVQARLTVKLNP